MIVITAPIGGGSAELQWPQLANGREPREIAHLLRVTTAQPFGSALPLTLYRMVYYVWVTAHPCLITYWLLSRQIAIVDPAWAFCLLSSLPDQPESHGLVGRGYMSAAAGKGR